MTNYEVLQTMTVKELALYTAGIDRIISYTMRYSFGGGMVDVEKWLRMDSQDKGGLLTDEVKRHWKVQ